MTDKTVNTLLWAAVSFMLTLAMFRNGTLQAELATSSTQAKHYQAQTHLLLQQIQEQEEEMEGLRLQMRHDFRTGQPKGDGG